MELQPYNDKFQKVVNIIEIARENAYKKVNEELILMYRDIGKFISEQSANVAYDDAFVQQLEGFFEKNYPDLKGFNRRGLYRMKQFYELYKNEEKVSTLLTQQTVDKADFLSKAPCLTSSPIIEPTPDFFHSFLAD